MKGQPQSLIECVMHSLLFKEGHGRSFSSCTPVGHASCTCLRMRKQNRGTGASLYENITLALVQFIGCCHTTCWIAQPPQLSDLWRFAARADQLAVAHLCSSCTYAIYQHAVASCAPRCRIRLWSAAISWPMSSVPLNVNSLWCIVE